MGAVQGISGYQNASVDFRQPQISAPLQALIIAVTAVAVAALGFLFAGLAGLALGAILGTALGFTANILIHNCRGQSQIDPNLAEQSVSNQPQVFLPELAEIEIQTLPDVTDLEAANDLIEFYKLLPIDRKPQFDGSISEQAQQIQAWMDEPEIRDLKSLDLSNLNLTRLPKEIGLFICLKKLLLKNNQLQELPVQIATLRSLTHLDLSQNNFQALPPVIGDLQSLQHLILSNNQLKELPTQIGDLRSLRELYLDHNMLEDLPAEIATLSCLKVLSLCHNRFKVLPVALGRIPSLLDWIQLAGNEIPDLPAHIGSLHKNNEGGYW